MAYRGHIKDGVAIFDEPIQLPDGTPVRVEVEPLDADFWQGRSLDQLVREQGVTPCLDPADLAGAWPEEESLDEFLAFLREVRR
jgi:hypothetical protein